jgi:hypothetical protein
MDNLRDPSKSRSIRTLDFYDIEDFKISQDQSKVIVHHSELN